MSVQRPNITRSEGLTDYGRSAKKRFIDPQSPRSSDALVDPPQGSSNILYLVLAAAGISMGLSVFLYREMKRMKIDMDVTQKKIVKETKETSEETSQKITQLAQNMQALHIYIKNNAAVLGKPPPPQPVQIPDKEPNLPKPDGVKKVQIVEGGPSSEESGDLQCEDGICLLPSTEQSSGANVASPTGVDAPKEAKSEPKSSIEKTIDN
jgi:hypothetical protein